MTPERFRVLLQAYGADLQRWPDDERSEARALAAQDSPELRRCLAEEAALDGWLDDHTLAGPDEALVRRIATATTPAAVPAAVAGRGSWWRAGGWWPGAGLTITGLAGALAGALLVSVALRQVAPSAAIDWQARGTAFGELATDGSDE
jgi:hypothetical protein